MRSVADLREEIVTICGESGARLADLVVLEAAGESGFLVFLELEPDQYSNRSLVDKLTSDIGQLEEVGRVYIQLPSG